MPEATVVVEDPQLRARAAAGDLDAFADLYRLHRGRVFRYLMRRCGNHALADDLTSETFLRALRGLRHWRERGREFGAWLVTIAGNLLADHYRSMATRRFVLVGDFAGQESPRLVDSADVEWLAIGRADDGNRVRMWQQAFNSLTVRQQQVLILRCVEGLSVRDTARKLDIEEGAVKAAAYRARQTLAESPVVRTLWADLRDGGGA